MWIVSLNAKINSGLTRLELSLNIYTQLCPCNG